MKNTALISENIRDLFDVLTCTMRYHSEPDEKNGTKEEINELARLSRNGNAVAFQRLTDLLKPLYLSMYKRNAVFDVYTFWGECIFVTDDLTHQHIHTSFSEVLKLRLADVATKLYGEIDNPFGFTDKWYIDHVERLCEEYYMLHGTYPSVEQVMEDTGYKRDRITSLLERSHIRIDSLNAEKSVDTADGSGSVGIGTLEDTLIDEKSNTEEIVLKKEEYRLLHQAIENKLTDEERATVSLNDDDDGAKETVAMKCERMGISERQYYKLQKSAYAKIKKEIGE